MLHWEWFRLQSEEYVICPLKAVFALGAKVVLTAFSCSLYTVGHLNQVINVKAHALESVSEQ